MTIAQQKDQLRSAMLTARRAMTTRAEADETIAQAVCVHPWFQAAKQVFAYVSMPHEVGTKALLQAGLDAGKQLALPVCNTAKHTMIFYRLHHMQELKAGAYRIPVPPVSPERMVTPDADTLMLVPMLAYDAKGYRLGAGGGYYDRYLAAYPNLHTIGICYANGYVNALPVDTYDRPLQCCITETKTEEFYG